MIIWGSVHLKSVHHPGHVHSIELGFVALFLQNRFGDFAHST